MRLGFFAALLAVFAFGCSSSPAGVTLVKDGQSHTIIYVAPEIMAADKPPAPQRLVNEIEMQRQRLRESVKDLSLYMEKMSGAKVAISTDAPGEGKRDPQTAPIYVGDRAVQVFGPVGHTYTYKQAFRVVVSDKGAGAVGFMGESDLATTYGIYEVLDRLGCRWFMPGEMGECYPTLKTIELPTMDLKSAPGTIYRGIWYAGEGDTFKRRNRMGGLLLNAGHALEIAYLTPEDRAKHPEWIATIDGKPNPGRLKWSNKELASTLADKILALQATNPDNSYSLSPDDGLGFDNSAEDRALDAGDFDASINETSITDRLMVICNRISGKVNAKYPDVLFGVLAYASFVRPPLREMPNPTVVPQIAPITYARAHPMSDDRVPGNIDLRRSVEGWAKKAKMTSYYFYGWFLAEPVAPNPMLAKWGNDVPYVLGAGKCLFWQPETQPNFETSMHALYMGNRLAFTPSLKPADVYKDINEKFYGHAAARMTAYWEYIDHVWTDINDYSGCGFGYMRRWTPEKLKGARNLMQAALAAAQTPMEKARVGLASDSLALFDSFMKLRRDQAEGRFATIAEDAEAWQARLKKLAAQYKNNAAFTDCGFQITDSSYFSYFYQNTYKDASRVYKNFTIVTPKPLRDFKYVADPDKKGEAAGFAKPEFDDKAWKTTDVCVDTWSTLGYHDYFKSMWYRTQTEIPAAPAGKKVYLWLASTDGRAKVFVNGKAIPYVKSTPQPDKSVKTETLEAAESYCEPFTFDITSAVKPGSNQISIFCTRTFMNELGTGGLLGPVVVYRDKD